MFEKVNPSHPDKLADRIAGALVDMAYQSQESPRIAVEVLLGHGECHIIAETSAELDALDVAEAVWRITGTDGDTMEVRYTECQQDAILAGNQTGEVRCGDNGIFRGVPVTEEQRRLSGFMRELYGRYPYDGKAILDGGRLTLCQSNADTDELVGELRGWEDYLVNPLGPWTGGPDVDTGATNRKLGSDMGDAVTGGGIHGKDLSKADVSVNIACHMLAQEYGVPVAASCSIGDEWVVFDVGGRQSAPHEYAHVVRQAGEYVMGLGGFEALAEWGLV